MENPFDPFDPFGRFVREFKALQERRELEHERLIERLKRYVEEFKREAK